MPHDLTVNGSNFHLRIIAKRNEMEPFLKRLIGNEKWITYDNNVRKRSWSKQGEAPQTVPKSSLTSRKVMYVWWD